MSMFEPRSHPVINNVYRPMMYALVKIYIAKQKFDNIKKSKLICFVISIASASLALYTLYKMCGLSLKNRLINVIHPKQIQED